MNILFYWIMGVGITAILGCIAQLIYPDKEDEAVIFGSFLFPIMFPIAIACVLRACFRRIRSIFYA